MGPQQLKATAQRALAVTGLVALALPMVTVTSCSGDQTPTTWTGIGVYTDDGFNLFALGAMVLISIVVLAWPLGRRVLPGADLAHAGLQTALLALAAIIAGFLPFLNFLFDTVDPGPGWFLHGGSYVVLAIMGAVFMVKAATGLGGLAPLSIPERTLSWMVLVAPALSGVIQGPRDGGTLVFMAGSILLIGVPLSLGLLGVGRMVATKEPRWKRGRAAGLGLALPWLLLWVAGAL